MPPALGRSHRGQESTQQAFGRFFSDLVREAPEVAERVVTVSPDVASSTNLGGWLGKVGVWSVGDRRDWFADDPQTLVHWHESTAGRHFELGIAETNLVGLLGELGATWSRYGQPLLPIGTIYDPFVGRALEPWSFGMYAGGQSILVGTPSGVSLAPEGGAHQSIVTPSIGIAQPGCTAWEPAFGQDLEWTLLHALGRLGRPDGESAYFRLSTRPIDQALADRSAARPRPGRRLPHAPRRRAPARDAGRHGRRPPGGARRPPTRSAPTSTSSASPAPTSSSAPCAPALASTEGSADDPRAALPTPTAPPRSSPCWTAIRTRSRSWRRSTRPR